MNIVSKDDGKPRVVILEGYSKGKLVKERLEVKGTNPVISKTVWDTHQEMDGDK